MFIAFSTFNLLSVVLFSVEVLCYPYANIEGGQVRNNLVAPTKGPQFISFPNKRIVDVGFQVTPNPFSPTKDPRFHKYPWVDSDLMRTCPIKNRQNCGTNNRQICKRWDCCWDPNSEIVCAKAQYLIVETQVCGSSRLYNPRPRPIQDLRKNLAMFMLRNMLDRRSLTIRNKKISSNTISPKIYNGWESEKHSLPWTARIFQGTEESNTICGATLVSHQWVVTAAHCVSMKDISTYTVVLGDHDQTDRDGHEQFRKVSKIVLADYDKNTRNNDIALLKLSSPVVYDDYVSAICLPPQGTPTDGPEGTPGSYTFQWGLVVGWGVNELGVKSNKLTEVEIPVLPPTSCQLYHSDFLPGQSKFCAGMPGYDNCQGDDGGPLILFNEDDFKIYMHGIVSYNGGDNCGVLPGVYTKVSDFTDWILKNIR